MARNDNSEGMHNVTLVDNAITLVCHPERPGACRRGVEGSVSNENSGFFDFAAYRDFALNDKEDGKLPAP